MPFEDEIIRIRAEVVERSARNAQKRVERMAEDMAKTAEKVGGKLGEDLFNEAIKLLDTIPKHMKSAMLKADKDWERGWQKIAADGEGYLNKIAAKTARQAGTQAGNNFADSFNTAAKNKLDTHLITTGRGTGNRVAGRGTGAVNMAGLPYPIGATSPVPIESVESYQRRMLASNPIEGPDNYYERQAAEAKKVQSIREAALNRERARQRKLAKESEATQRKITSQLRKEERRRNALRDKALRAERKRQAEILVARRATAARSLRIAAGLAGAMGNFRVASGLFTVSTGVQGMPSEYFSGEGSSITKVGKSAAKWTPVVAGFTAALGGLAIGVSSLKRGLQLEKELADVSTLLTTSSLAGVQFSDALETIENKAIELSSTFNIELSDAIAGFKTALSAGIDAPYLADFSEQAAVLSTSLGATFDESVNILTTLRDTYGATTRELTSMTNVLFRSVDEGKITISDLNTNLGRVASIAAQAGLSMEEMSSGLAFLTRQGLTPSRAITSYARLIEGVIDPSEKAAKAFRELGITFGANVLRDKGILGVIEDIRRATGGDFEALSKLFPRQQAVRAVAAMVKNYEGLADLTGKISSANADSNDAIDAANRRLNNTQVTLERIGKTISSELARQGSDFSGLIMNMLFGEVSPSDVTSVIQKTRLAVTRILESVKVGFAGVGAVGSGVVSVFKGISSGNLFGNGFRGFATTISSFKESLGEIALQKEINGLRIARDLVGEDLPAAIEVLVDKTGLSRKEAEELARAWIKEGWIDEAIEKLNRLGDTVEDKLNVRLNSLNKQLEKSQIRQIKLTEEQIRLQEAYAKGGLFEEESRRLKILDEQIARLKNNYDLFLQTQITNNTESAIGRVSEALLDLEDATNSVSSGAAKRGFDTLRTSLRSIAEDNENAAQPIEDLIYKLNRLEKAFVKSFGTEQMILEAEKVQQLVEEGIPSILDLIIGDTSANRRASMEMQIKELEDARQAILDIGTERGGEQGAEKLKNISKALSDYRKQLNEAAQVGNLEALAKEKASLERRIQSLANSMREGVDVSSEYNSAMKRLKSVSEDLTEAEKLREQKQKEQQEAEKQRLRQREELVRDLTSRVEAFEREHLEAVRDFERQKTEAIKEQHDKRRSIIEKTNDIIRRTEESGFSNRLSGARSDRQRRRIAREEMANVESQVREAAQSGDANAFYNAIQRYESLRDTRIGLTEGRRSTRISEQANSFIKRQVGDFRGTALGDIGSNIRKLERAEAPALDRESLIKALTESTSSVKNMVEKLVNEEGNIIVDKSTSELRVTINGDADWARELFNEMRNSIDEKTNNRPDGEKNEVAPPDKTMKPLGSRYGVSNT